MSNLIKVKDHKELVRDSYSKAILNTDEHALINHRKNKHLLKEVFLNSERMKSMESELDEMKKMLNMLLEKNKVQ